MKLGIVTLGFLILLADIAVESSEHYDPCCSFPCQNNGICEGIGFTDQYTCDCYGTEHYGHDCEIPTFTKWIYDAIRPSQFTVQYILTHGHSLWKILNNINPLHDFLMVLVIKMRIAILPWPDRFNTKAEYATWDGYSNKSYYALTMSPVPKNCPTPMGVAGPKVLPNTSEMVKKIFARTEFKPCPRGTSVLLPLYGQHFTHQGFKTVMKDRRLTWGSHALDGSHIYGETLEKQAVLRTMMGGKMKMQVVKGETYPPNIKDTPGIEVPFPPHVPQEDRYGMAHPFFSLYPTLMYWTTVWLREHNRVCGILAKEHPDWDDEHLYQTARLVVMGEILTVTVQEYVQHVAGMGFQFTYEPDLIHESNMRWSSSRIHAEFNILYHWHTMIPDVFHIGGMNYSIVEMYYNMKPLTDNGMAVFTESLSNQLAGRGAGGRNIPEPLLYVAEKNLGWSRELRLRPFNHYRKFFRLPPFKTFEELTGETKLARVISDFYGGDIDAVEFYIGIMVEKRHPRKMFGLTLIEAIASYAIRSVFSTTLASPEYWRESTFGGKTGFDLVRNATFKDIICRNVKGCPLMKLQMEEFEKEFSDPGMIYNDIELPSETNCLKDKCEL